MTTTEQNPPEDGAEPYLDLVGSVIRDTVRETVHAWLEQHRAEIMAEMAALLAQAETTARSAREDFPP